MKAIDAPYRVISAERGVGKLIARGSISIPGVVAELRVVVLDSAKGPFAAVDAPREGPGGYTRPVRFEQGVADTIAAAILSRLGDFGEP